MLIGPLPMAHRLCTMQSGLQAPRSGSQAAGLDQALLEAAASADVEEMEQLLKDSANPNAVNEAVSLLFGISPTPTTKARCQDHA